MYMYMYMYIQPRACKACYLTCLVCYIRPVKLQTGVVTIK